MNFAASRQVNPSGAMPKLTEKQVWKGLELKTREPKSFVAAITECEIISDTGNKVVRRVRFGEAPKTIEEVVELYKGTIAYFEAPELGGRITNLLSYDKDGEMVLTFSFANGIPGVSEGKPPSELNKMIGGVVEHTIERIRELVQGGVIQ
ncbi:hypothetical protein M413DRAFT_444915 [Hebeloma cylindrosporum]|uniref:DUF1857-domain-containing protein n=1 Tax=Hebeloma cylindrosporum TaxID=76867 RepID=A0A0C3BYK4_HEBCY|nr:hypothetical protein M413DRAFT_444915 [Hebeloma cylindrosporum h7]